MSRPASFLGTGLTAREAGDVAGLSGIFGLRLLGLFLLLPVLSVYARGLDGATPFLAGLAVGAYGLSQVLLQVPLGLLSDRIGRRAVIIGGQAVYAAGCVLAAYATTIEGLLAARLVQGAGAIASVVVAMIADVTRDEVRGRAMAVVGMTVGVSFVTGFLAGPFLAARWGVPALFWILAALDVAAIGYLAFLLPPPAHEHKGDVSIAHLKTLIADRNLACLDVMMFVLHLANTAIFVVTPFFLHERFAPSEVWRPYGLMILAGGGIMLPAMIYAESRKKLRQMIFAGIVTAGAGSFLLGASRDHGGLLVAGLTIYFIGFNLIEPVLPSLVTRFAPAALRGGAVGVFNMSQFLGTFAGGAIGGLFLGYQPYWLYGFLLVLCVPWALAASRLDDPAFIRTIQLDGPSAVPVHSAELRRHDGIYDARRLPDGRLEVRYSTARLDESALKAFLHKKGLI